MTIGGDATNVHMQHGFAGRRGVRWRLVAGNRRRVSLRCGGLGGDGDRGLEQAAQPAAETRGAILRGTHGKPPCNGNEWSRPVYPGRAKMQEHCDVPRGTNVGRAFGVHRCGVLRPGARPWESVRRQFLSAVDVLVAAFHVEQGLVVRSLALMIWDRGRSLAASRPWSACIQSLQASRMVGCRGRPCCAVQQRLPGMLFLILIRGLRMWRPQKGDCSIFDRESQGSGKLHRIQALPDFSANHPLGAHGRSVAHTTPSDSSITRLRLVSKKERAEGPSASRWPMGVHLYGIC